MREPPAAEARPAERPPLPSMGQGRPSPFAAADGEASTNTRVRGKHVGAILCAMSTDSHRIPAKPTLDGLEDKWTQRWAKERVVQV